MNTTLARPAISKRTETDPIICYCHEVRRSQIERAVDLYGETAAIRVIQLQTKATTGCGGCLKRVIRMINNEQPTQPSPCSFCDNCRCIRKLCTCCAA